MLCQAALGPVIVHSASRKRLAVHDDGGRPPFSGNVRLRPRSPRRRRHWPGPHLLPVDSQSISPTLPAPAPPLPPRAHAVTILAQTRQVFRRRRSSDFQRPRGPTAGPHVVVRRRHRHALGRQCEDFTPRQGQGAQGDQGAQDDPVPLVRHAAGLLQTGLGRVLRPRVLWQSTGQAPSP